MNSDIKILQSKLKRNNIPSKIEGQRLLISKARVDLLEIILVVVTFLIALAIAYFILVADVIRLKFILIAFGAAAMGIFYLRRILVKYNANKSKKVLYNHRFQIDDRYYDAENTENVFGEIIEIKEDEVYQVTLFLTDTHGQKVMMLQIDESAESLAHNEMNWMIAFFTNYLKV